VERAVVEGWMSLADGHIVLKVERGEASPIVYRIVSPPGFYCCHCEKALDDGSAARAHVAAAHEGQASPDPDNPAGYRRDNFYRCERTS
jgi:hypothetical protein